MQGIIMAAGKGSRLGDANKNMPKSFLEIEGKKLLEYNLDMLTKYGINDIIIVTGYMVEEFEKLLGDRKDIRIVYNPFYDSTNVLSSFWFGQELLEDDFIYMHADTICDTEIFEDLLSAEGDIVLPVDFRPCDEEAMKVELDKVSGQVKFINKTMDLSLGDGEFIGICKISKNSIPKVKSVTNKIMREQKFSSFFEVALQSIIDNDLCKLTTIPTKGKFWCEVDFKEDYERAIEGISENLKNL